MSVLTLLICVVVAAGDGPIEGGGGEPEPYLPTEADLREVGVITDDFPVPGALPPEVFPADAWGISPPGAPAWLPWALVGLVLLWVGVRLAREPAAWRIARPRRRVRAAPEPEAPEDDAIVARRAVDAALAPLREPTNPRAAVIEAYARLEEVVGQRRSGEAPREYLSRVLVEHRVPERSLTALTELFEEARFSRHPIGAAASERAAGELRAVRAALATGSSDPR